MSVASQLSCVPLLLLQQVVHVAVLSIVVASVVDVAKSNSLSTFG